MKTRNPARGGVSRDAALGMAANSDADYTAIEAQNLKRMRKQSVEAAVLKACGEGGHVQHH
jgi:hypothetical protein